MLSMQESTTLYNLPKNGRLALPIEQELEITARFIRGDKMSALAREFGVHRHTIRAIIARRNIKSPGDQTEASTRLEDANATSEPSSSEMVPASSPTTQPQTQ